MNDRVSIKGALVFLISLVILVTVLSITGAFTLSTTFKETMKQSTDAGTLLRAQGDGDMMHDALRGDFYGALLHSVRGDAVGQTEIKKDLADHKKTWHADLATMRSTPKSAEIEKAFLEIEPHIAAYMEQTEKLIDLTFTDQKAALDKLVEFDKLFEAMEKRLAAFADLIEKRNKEITVAADARASSVATTTTIIGVVLIVFMLLVSWYAARTVGGHIRHIMGATKALASGDADLTRRLPVMSGELGNLSVSMNTFMARLHGIVSEVVMKSSSIATASAQISAGSTDLSSRTEQQAATLEETASSMEEFTTSIRQTADNTKLASKSARLAIENAQAGRGIVVQAGQRMTDIHASAKRITEITSIIDSIAFQTNILALNAAVEAARAGEQGRGFAVVASEVRALAQRSASSAKDIKRLIDETATSIEAGTELVRNAESAMDKIVASNQEVLLTVTDISNASTEQATGVDHVNRAIMQLEGVTQQNAALVEESSAASESMCEQAEQLRDLVSQFKLEGGVERKEARSAAVHPATESKSRAAVRGAARMTRLPRTNNVNFSAAHAATKDEDWKEF